jgi:hypothetical protein
VQRIANALSLAAAYLPAGRALNEAHAERRVLTAEMLKASWSYSGERADLIARFYRLKVQIREDLKGLGLGRCLGPPPRPPISG